MHQVRDDALTDRRAFDLAQLEDQCRNDVVLLSLGLAEKQHPRLAIVVGKGLGTDAHVWPLSSRISPVKPRLGSARGASEASVFGS